MGAKNWPTKYCQNVISLKSQQTTHVCISAKWFLTCTSLIRPCSYFLLSYFRAFLKAVSYWWSAQVVRVKIVPGMELFQGLLPLMSSEHLKQIVFTSMTLKVTLGFVFLTVSLNQLWAMQTSIAWSTVRRYSLLSDQLGKQ